MNIHVKYFGMIAEAIQCTSEQITLNQPLPVNLKIFFENKYPQLKAMDYKIAINQQIKHTITQQLQSVEVALLPPFAGG